MTDLPVSNQKMISALFFRLLPMQVLLAAINAVNGFVSGLFAGNSIGDQALSAVGLYFPISAFFTAVGLLFMGGSQVLCGKYLAQNRHEDTNGVFSLDLIIVFVASAIFTVLLLAGGIFDLTAVFTSDIEVRMIFNQYLIGQAVGVIPMLFSQQLSAFLSLEKKNRRVTTASIVCIAVTLLLSYLLVVVLRKGAFGLALAASLGFWAFLIVQLQHYFSGKSILKFKISGVRFSECKNIIKIGLSGALTQGYQVVRGLIVNGLILQYVGAAGLSAFGASNSLLALFWGIPNGVLAVARMLMSVSVGEEDRQSLTDTMRVVLFKTIPLMWAVSIIIILLAVPFAGLFYQDTSLPAYSMTVAAFRILPLCMPFSIMAICFVCYGQITGKQAAVHLESILDGVICVAGFSALLIGSLGMNAVYIANVLNGVVTVLFFLFYSWIVRKKFPRNMEQLMVIPDNFGAQEKDRLDISITGMEDVVKTSEQIHRFCLAHGVDEKRAYYASLCLEEMAGNVVDHGFTKDRKKHRIDVRVVFKDEKLILRIKDDCIPFDPAQRKDMRNPEDPCKNIGIRMVYRIAEKEEYQNLLGLNVLTLTI